MICTAGRGYSWVLTAQSSHAIIKSLNTVIKTPLPCTQGHRLCVSIILKVRYDNATVFPIFIDTVALRVRRCQNASVYSEEDKDNPCPISVICNNLLGLQCRWKWEKAKECHIRVVAAQIRPGRPESSARAWVWKPIINYMSVQYKLNTQ